MRPPHRLFLILQKLLGEGMKDYRFQFAPNGTFTGIQTFPASTEALPDVPGPPFFVPNLQASETAAFSLLDTKRRQTRVCSLHDLRPGP